MALLSTRAVAVIWMTGLIIALLTPMARAERLTADNLLLIVNRNEPAGRELAEYYRQARGVPEGRIVELDLPAQDTLPRAQFGPRVVDPVRKFITDNGLREQVRCAVTFYGVPLSVGSRHTGEAEKREIDELQRSADELVDRLGPLVREAEDIARLAGLTPDRATLPATAPATEQLRALLERLAAVETRLSQQARTLPPERQRELAGRVGGLRERLGASFGEGAGENGGLDPARVASLLERGAEPEARQALRDMVRGRGSLQEYAVILIQQQNYLDSEQSDASFDSELALLWQAAPPAARWLANPLATGNPAPRAADVLMTARLDGQDPQQVRDVIAESLLVEREGLTGKIVIDSRGIPPRKADGSVDAYGVFDEQLRNLAAYLDEHAALEVVHDDAPEVIQPPGVGDVAVYVGWYSLTKYVPAFTFERGAVGYHVASFEMRSLRDPRKPGWVVGLLKEGVVATLGPVSEPYLTAFPPPERFFPLLLTGKLTLAEVYWTTVPQVSWKMGLIGDPLYRPFARTPALEVEALPEPLRGLVR